MMDFDKIKGDVKIRAFEKSDDYFDGWLNVNIESDSTSVKSDAKWDLSKQVFFKRAICDVFFLEDFLFQMLKGDEYISFMLANIKNILRTNGVFIVGLSDIRNVGKLEKWLDKIGFEDVLFYDRKLELFSRKHAILSEFQNSITDRIPCFIKVDGIFENVKKSVDEFVNYSDKLDIYLLADKKQEECLSYFKELLEKDLIKKYVMFDEEINENVFEEYLLVNKETFSQYENIILADCNSVLNGSKWIDELKKMLKYPEIFSASVLPNNVELTSEKVLNSEERDLKHSSEIFSCSMFKTKGFYAILKYLISKGSFFTRKELVNTCYNFLRMSNGVSKNSTLEVLSGDNDKADAAVKEYSGFTEYSSDGENRQDEYYRIYYV